MARARLLKPEFFANEDLAKLSLRARLLFAGLWTLADKRGRLLDKPLRIKGALFPYEDVDIEESLAELAVGAFIVRYVVDGQSLILVATFERHQKTHIHEPESRLPAPLPEIGSASTDIGSAESAIVGSRPKMAPKAEAVNKAEAEAKAKAESRVRSVSEESRNGFEYNLEPPFPDDPGFTGEYVRHYERLHGRGPGSSQMADASQLERDFGFTACMQVAQDTNWEKPPSWLRPKLEQRTREPTGPPEQIHKPSLRYGAKSS